MHCGIIDKILYKFHKFVQKWESLRYSIFFKNTIDKEFSTGKVFRFTLKKPWFYLEKRYFYTVTTKFSTDRGENKKKADRFLSDIQSAQKRLWKRLGRVGFFWKTFDFAGYIWYN